MVRVLIDRLAALQRDVTHTSAHMAVAMLPPRGLPKCHSFLSVPLSHFDVGLSCHEKQRGWVGAWVGGLVGSG